MEVVINRCYGGFSLSKKAKERLRECGVVWKNPDTEVERENPILIQVVKELGVEAASGTFCKLKIIEIPDGIEWLIQDHDGYEYVAEAHRTWS